jgi:retinol dehydrogenase-12
MSFFGWLLYLASIAFILYILRKFFNGPKTNLSKDMTGKVIIVTGSNVGIGMETALELLSKNGIVIFACRDEVKTNLVINSIKDTKQRENAKFMKLDLSNLGSILQFVQDFKRQIGRLDILINNAGGMFDSFSLTEGVETTFKTNHVGNVILCAMLLDCINPEGKIINVASGSHHFITQQKFDALIKDSHFTGNDYNFWNAYSLSKLANILHAKHLDIVLSKMHKRIKTASLHPGVVKTEFFRGNSIFIKILKVVIIPFQYIFFKDSKMGAQTTLHVAYLDYNLLNSGAFFIDCREENTSRVASDPNNMVKMMEFTKEVITKNVKEIPTEINSYFSF